MTCFDKKTKCLSTRKLAFLTENWLFGHWLVETNWPSKSDILAKPPCTPFSPSEDTARSAKLFKPERVTLKRTSKDEITCQILLKAFRNNKILKTLDIIQLNDMIACMVPINFAKNESFIKYKEKGDYLYVIVNGDICVEDPNKPAFNLVANTGNPIAMGEIALWSNAERTASCTIVSENGGYGFKLTAAEFDTVMSELVEQRKDNKEEFLKKVLMDKHGITMNQVKLNSLIMSAKIVEYRMDFLECHIFGPAPVPGDSGSF